MNDLITAATSGLFVEVGKIIEHMKAQASRIADLERQLAEASAPAVEQQPVAYMFDVQVKRLGQRRQFAAIDYNLDSDETLVAKSPLYTAPQAADTDKVREAILAIEPKVPKYLDRGGRLNYECAFNDALIAAAAAAELVASMAAQAPVREVPEGWKLIPLKPTYEMRCAFQFARKVEPYKVSGNWSDPTAPVVAHYESDSFDIRWDAMLAAAPLPAAPVQQEDE